MVKIWFTACELYIYQDNFDTLIQRTLTSVIKKKNYIKEKIKDSTHVGILICSLSIKDLLERIDRVKSLCKKANKKCYIFSVGRPNVAKLANFPEVINFLLRLNSINTCDLCIILDWSICEYNMCRRNNRKSKRIFATNC